MATEYYSLGSLGKELHGEITPIAVDKPIDRIQQQKFYKIFPQKIQRTKYPFDIELLTKEANRMREFAVPYCEHESPGWRMARWTEADGNNPMPEEIETYLTKVAKDLGFHDKVKYSCRIYYLIKGSSSCNHIDQTTTAALNIILNTNDHQNKVGVTFGGEYGGTDYDEMITYNQGLLNTTLIHGINNVTEEERITFKFSMFDTPFEEVCKMIPEKYKDNGEFDEASITEPASSEAEQANRTIDAREQKSADRLNINRPPPQTTSWERENKMQEQKTKVVAGDNNEKQPDKPKEEKKQEQPKYPFNDAEPIFAYYGNDKKTLLFFVLRHPDGPQGQPGPTDTHQIHKTKEHDAAWYWVHKLVGQEAIHRNTKKEIDRLDKMRKKEEVADKDRMHKMDQEKLFQAKIDAFEMDVIRNTTNREMKSKIRRSKSIMELTAYVGAIIALETMNGTKAAD